MRVAFRSYLPLVAMVIVLLLTSCAAELHRVPMELTQSAEDPRRMTLARAVEVTPSTGYARTLKAGSVWKLVGRISPGNVFAVQDDVFMLEGKHMHEAYCVVEKETLLVGFYLPVERAFVPIAPPVSLPVNYQ